MSATETTEKVRKSIVPAKYGNKYKKGGADELAQFITKQCTGEGDKIDIAKFFALCRKNGVAEANVAKFEALVATGRGDAPGRARMTLRNSLTTPCRKNGGLTGLDDTFQVIALAVREKPATPSAE
jgi:hypothetical protein